jgi:hypothetical protein
MKTFKQFLEESKYSAEKNEHHAIWFHASPYKFKGKILPMSHFGSAGQIRSRVKSFTNSGTGNIGDNVKNVFGARLKLKNGLEIQDFSKHHTHYHIIDQLHQKGIFSSDHAKNLKNEISYIYSSNENNQKNAHKYSSEHLARAIKQKGFDHLYYHNKQEGNVSDPSNKSVVILDPKQVRVIYNNKNLKTFRNNESKS